MSHQALAPCTCPYNEPLAAAMVEFEEAYAAGGEQHKKSKPRVVPMKRAQKFIENCFRIRLDLFFCNYIIDRTAARRAIVSIRRCPLPIKTHEDALALDSVGPFFAKKIMSALHAIHGTAAPAAAASAAQPSGRSAAAAAAAQKDSAAGAQASGSAFANKRTLCLAANIAARERAAGTGGAPGKRRATAKAAKQQAMLPCPTSFAGGIWTPVLIFDTREEHAQASQAAVLNANMLCEVRSLPLGDMLWVARNMDRQSPSYLQEVLLGYIVERKTASDLGSSMVDGRFHEQKHRMARHGLGRVIYLVEGPITHTTRLTPAHLRTAMAHTQAQDGMTVLWTANVTESVAHLQRVHRHIAASLEAACRGITASAPGTGVRPIMSMDQYRAQCGKGKDGDVRYVFGCQLRQVYGCSAARAAAILNEYPTPLDFMLAMEAAGESERCLELLAGIKGEPGARMAEAKLTKPLQAALCKLYADDDYH